MAGGHAGQGVEGKKKDCSRPGLCSSWCCSLVLRRPAVTGPQGQAQGSSAYLKMKRAGLADEYAHWTAVSENVLLRI